MKDWTVLATFPQLPSSIAEQMVSVNAGNPGLAVNRAFAQMRKQPRIKGCRIHSVTFNVRLKQTAKQVEEAIGSFPPGSKFTVVPATPVRRKSAGR